MVKGALAVVSESAKSYAKLRLNEGYALRNRATDKKDACKNVDTVKSKRES